MNSKLKALHTLCTEDFFLLNTHQRQGVILFRQDSGVIPLVTVFFRCSATPNAPYKAHSLPSHTRTRFVEEFEPRKSLWAC